MIDTASMLNSVLKLAKEAGEKIMAIYQQLDPVVVHTKQDSSPLTAADLAAHETIQAGLKALTPQWPILSEESTAIAFAERISWSQYWLVDPLDGTKEFIRRNGEFTVNIALIKNHEPILGVLYAPALELCYFAARGQGAFKQQGQSMPQSIKTRNYHGDSVIVAASRSHGSNQLDTFLARLENYTILQRGSALKCGLVAEGSVDLYPRLGPTSEWDIAAGQCIIEQAGGKIIDLKGQPLRYNTKESLENPPFLAVGDPKQDWLQFTN